MIKTLIPQQSANQSLVDFVNANNQVTGYALAINKAQIPVLKMPPAGYGDIIASVAKIKSHALVWLQTIVESYSSISSSFITYDYILQDQMTGLATALDQLKQNPHDLSARNSIDAVLKKMQAGAGNSFKIVDAFESAIDNFGQTMQPDAESLKALIGQLADDENADQVQVANLQAVISRLHGIIDHENEILTLQTIANWTFKLFVVVVGVSIGAPFQSFGVSIVLGLIGATATTFLPLDKKVDFTTTVADLNKQIDQVSEEVGVINTVVAQLGVLSSQIESLVAKNESGKKAIADVKAFWQQIETDLSSLTQNIDAIVADYQSAEKIDQAIRELGQAKSDWDAVMKTVKQLNQIEFNIDDSVFLPANEKSTEKV